MKSRAVFLCFCAALLAAAESAAAGREARAPQDRPAPAPLQNEVSVILKLVQVFVTDRAGKPVTDLRLEDFELRDNGTPQAISAFEVHALALPGPGPATAPARPSGPAAAGAGPRPGRKFLLVFDYFMNDPGGIRRAKETAVHFIDNRLLSGDEVGVMSLSTDKGFVLEQNMTADRRAAKSAIQGMKMPTKLRDYEDTYTLRIINPDEETVDEKEAENEFMVRESGRYCDELKALAGALKSIEGFKNVLFFSRGLPRDLMTGGDIGDPNNRFGTMIYEQYQSMLNDMSRSSSPVYAINTLGPRGFSKDGDRGTDALVSLADASGGAYFPTADHAAPLTGKIHETTANYYVLGYSIGLSWDGRYHELHVRVKRPGCEVRAQAGYYDPKQYADLSPSEKQVQLMDLVRGGSSPFLVPRDIPLEVLPYSAGAETGSWNCVVLAELAAQEIRELAGSKAELFFFIYDDKREAVWSKRIELVLTEIASGAACPYSPAFLPPGRFEAKAALRGLESGMTVLGKAAFVIPADPGEGPSREEKAGLRLDPPLLLRPGKETSYLKAAGKNEKSELPSLVAIYPFASNKAAPAVGILETAASPLQAIIRIAVGSDSALPDLKWSARFVRISPRREIPAAAVEIMSQAVGGAVAFLLEIERPGLEPGEYSLEIRAVDEASGQEAGTEARVRVK